MPMIEHEGALYRGFGRAHPLELYTREGWKLYAKAGEAKPVEWGSVIDDTAAAAIMKEIEG